MREEEIRQLPEVITVNEIAEILNVGKDIAYKIVRQNDFPKIPHIKGKYPKSKVLTYLNIK